MKLTYSNVKEKFAEIKRIKKEEDLDEAAVYYSDEYIRIGNQRFSFVRLYDEEFEFIEDVDIAYTNLLKDLTRITGKPDASAMAAYHLEQLEKGFYRVCEMAYTERALESISKTVTKEKGWNV